MVRACLEPFVPPQEPYMTDSMNPSTDDFASMFESSAAASAMQEGQVVPATVSALKTMPCSSTSA
jgi:small subunit ribosomal protein S1